MHTLKFLSVAASFLYFAIAQGVVIDAEPVPLYGQCGTKIGTVCTIFDSSSRLAHLASFSACSANRNLASAQGVCCYIHPDDGICLLNCPSKKA
ncbi:hypothetical protein C8J57DRAFT_1508428 [Mycena rebaudengoi]|nr:hypothetical protein C8J57DRAFT_1508428 [Mycena rebaudengoi]